MMNLPYRRWLQDSTFLIRYADILWEQRRMLLNSVNFEFAQIYMKPILNATGVAMPFGFNTIEDAREGPDQ